MWSCRGLYWSTTHFPLGHRMQLGQTQILDTYAEAFRLRFVRLLVTAADDYWLEAALRAFVGYGSSVIGCDAEVGVERYLATSETPDGRPGAAVLAFGFSASALAQAVPNRVGQTWLTCPTTAVFNGLAASDTSIPLGQNLRYFGDGYQQSKLIGGRRYWRVPVMDGEFLVEEKLGVAPGVGGGNIILQDSSPARALAAARRASEALADQAGVITPFPGGVVRSGSKVGSRYPGLVASTNEAFCPTLRGRVDSQLVTRAQCSYEIVVNGVDQSAVAAALQVALAEAAAAGVLAIGAGNYGGQLGKFHFHLHQLLLKSKLP